MPASMRGVQIEKSGGIKSDGIRPQQSESQSPYPRSLAEYCIFGDFLNKIFHSRLIIL